MSSTVSGLNSQVHGWSREGYDRYNVLSQRVKINRRDLGASFDFHVKIYEEHQDQGSLGDRSKAEDYVLPLTMNDFDEEEEDDHDDDSEGPRQLTAAEEESIRREATHPSILRCIRVFLMIDKKWLDWSIAGEFVQVYLQVHLNTC